MSRTVTVGIVFALVIVLWGLTPFWVQAVSATGGSGQFGDQFGAVNALFSGLAFAAFFYTVLLQQHQLDLQRQELSLQREEMRASREELANQVKVQRALLKATIAQIAVSGFNAEIEANKLEANAKVPTVLMGPGEECTAIRSMASAMRALADKLESEMPGVG